MNTWTPLWNGIVESSVWTEPDFVRVVWITILAIKDSDDVVRANAFNLARKANKTEEEVLKALKVLSSPDRKRLEKQPYEGRRIKKVDDGWLILNGQVYREKVQDEMRKARWRRAQAAKRRRQRGVDTGLDGKPASGAYKAEEQAEVKRHEQGLPSSID
jgi:hypothetical protein